MKNNKNCFRSIFSCLFILAILLLSFYNHHDISLKVCLSVGIIVICFFVVLFDGIDEWVRIIIVCVLSAGGIANSIDYLFCFLPVIMQLLSFKDSSDKIGKEKTIKILLSVVHIICEIVILLKLKKSNIVFVENEKMRKVFILIIVFFELFFIASFIAFVKRLNVKGYIRQINKIKNKKRASSSDKILLSEYETLKIKMVIAFFNICYVLNVLFYCMLQYYNTTCTISVLVWIVYSAFWINTLLEMTPTKIS